MDDEQRKAKIGESLKHLRIRAGIKSQHALAGKAGVHPNSVQAHEAGEAEMGILAAIAYADALHCTLDELAGRSPPGQERPPYLRDEPVYVINREFADGVLQCKRRADLVGLVKRLKLSRVPAGYHYQVVIQRTDAFVTPEDWTATCAAVDSALSRLHRLKD